MCMIFMQTLLGKPENLCHITTCRYLCTKTKQMNKLIIILLLLFTVRSQGEASVGDTVTLSLHDCLNRIELVVKSEVEGMSFDKSHVEA